MSLSPCPGCRGAFSDTDGPVHRYMISSPGCWRGFGELLAAQHPGSGNLPQQVQSVGLHLMTLCLFLENAVDPALGTALHRKMVRRPAFRRLVRSGPGLLTYAHVPSTAAPDVVRAAVYQWGAAVWDTYRAEHPTVRTWLQQAGFDMSPSDR